MKPRLTLTRRIVLGVVVVTLAAVSTSGATHVFGDVPDDKFYTVPVEWASTNMITTGTGPTTFEPDRGVTRGESVTFLKRYEDNIVRPALDALEAADTDRYTKAEVNAGIAAVNADVDALDAALLLLDTRLTALETGEGTIAGAIRVNSDGTIADSWMANGMTPSVTHTATTGIYTITWPGHSFNINNQAGFGNVTGSSSGWLGLSSIGGDMRVYTYDTAGAATDDAFWAFILHP